MKFYTFILVIIVAVTMSRDIKFSPELQKNILKFGYGINYKYEGMLAHLFDRLYIITKCMLSSMADIKFSKLNLARLVCTWIRSIPLTQIQENI